MSVALLTVDGVSKSFRGLRALNAVSFDVSEGEIVALIGPNGAGKTTLFNVIAGVFRADEGSVALAGRSLNGLRPDQICHAGIGRTFQIVRPFRDMTLLENATVGAFRWTDRYDEARDYAFGILDSLGLAAKGAMTPEHVTLPDRKKLEVARALATRPRILLLDEVMAGLRPTEVDQMVETLSALNRESGLTIVLIEHVMRAVVALSQRVVVLNHGQKIASGTPQEVVRDPAVLECYLGEGEIFA